MINKYTVDTQKVIPHITPFFVPYSFSKLKVETSEGKKIQYNLKTRHVFNQVSTKLQKSHPPSDLHIY